MAAQAEKRKTATFHEKAERERARIEEKLMLQLKADLNELLLKGTYGKLTFVCGPTALSVHREVIEARVPGLLEILLDEDIPDQDRQMIVQSEELIQFIQSVYEADDLAGPWQTFLSQLTSSRDNEDAVTQGDNSEDLRNHGNQASINGEDGGLLNGQNEVPVGIASDSDQRTLTEVRESCPQGSEDIASGDGEETGNGPKEEGESNMQGQADDTTENRAIASSGESCYKGGVQPSETGIGACMVQEKDQDQVRDTSKPDGLQTVPGALPKAHQARASSDIDEHNVTTFSSSTAAGASDADSLNVCQFISLDPSMNVVPKPEGELKESTGPSTKEAQNISPSSSAISCNGPDRVCPILEESHEAGSDKVGSGPKKTNRNSPSRISPTHKEAMSDLEVGAQEYAKHSDGGNHLDSVPKTGELVENGIDKPTWSQHSHNNVIVINSAPNDQLITSENLGIKARSSDDGNLDAHHSDDNGEGTRLMERLEKLPVPRGSVSENLLMLLEQDSSPFSDVAIVLGDTAQIRAHKCILHCRSEFFAAMLGGGWLESESQQVELRGISPSVVRVILRFTYSGNVDLTDAANLRDVIGAADMYGFQGLKELAAFYLKRDWCHFFHKPLCADCLSLIPPCFALCESYALPDLASTCLRWMTKHMDRFWPQKVFASLPPDLLEKCSQDVLESLSASNALDVLFQLDKTKLSLPQGQSSWAEPTKDLTGRTRKKVLQFASSHFRLILRAHRLEQKYFKGMGWKKDVMEAWFRRVIADLSLDTADGVFLAIWQLYKNKTAEEEWNPDAFSAVGGFYDKIYSYVVSNASFMIHSNEFKALPEELQKQIRKDAVYVDDSLTKTTKKPVLSSSQRPKSSQVRRTHSNPVRSTSPSSTTSSTSTSSTKSASASASSARQRGRGVSSSSSRGRTGLSRVNSAGAGTGKGSGRVGVGTGAGGHGSMGRPTDSSAARGNSTRGERATGRRGGGRVGVGSGGLGSTGTGSGAGRGTSTRPGTGSHGSGRMGVGTRGGVGTASGAASTTHAGMGTWRRGNGPVGTQSGAQGGAQGGAGNEAGAARGAARDVTQRPSQSRRAETPSTDTRPPPT